MYLASRWEQSTGISTASYDHGCHFSPAQQSLAPLSTVCYTAPTAPIGSRANLDTKSISIFLLMVIALLRPITMHSFCRQRNTRANSTKHRPGCKTAFAVFILVVVPAHWMRHTELVARIEDVAKAKRIFMACYCQHFRHRHLANPLTVWQAGQKVWRRLLLATNH